jgi:hypothetical protein
MEVIDKNEIVRALYELQSVAEDAEHTLGKHDPQDGDPNEIVVSKAEGWERDYGPKMRPVLQAIKHLQKLTAL